MASLDEVRQVRLQKLALLKERGMDPYPATTARDFSLDQAVRDFAELEKSGKEITLAGRVMSLRPQGGLAFFHLYDGTAKFQGLLKQEEVSGEEFDFFNQVVDIGDFIEITGTLFLTKREEKTLTVKKWKMLSKSLHPLPEKWHGIQDVEDKLRNRYLDILFNPEVRLTVEKRAKFWQSMRNFLLGEGFLEVETPVLENTTGGADARPFVTHHNALDIDVYLRISAGELWQKKLMVAGFPKVFEIGRIFRNEGISHEHAQDYTQMEFYWAYADYEKGMELVERMYKYIAEETFGTLKFTIGEFEVDLGKKWERYDYTETIKKFTGVDIGAADLAEIEAALKKLKVAYDAKGWNKIRAIDTLWKYCRKQIGGPGFLLGVPKEMSPLAKPDPLRPETVEQFQPLIAGSEVGKGYSELNDPIDQAERFAAQAALRDAGDEEAQMNDESFVEALEYGMPPTCGFGISERLFAFLLNKPVREAQIFPLMRPKDAPTGKKKENQIAVAVVSGDAKLEEWQTLNTIGHLSAAFGARTGKKLFTFDSVETADNKAIPLNIRHAIIIKKSDSLPELQLLAKNGAANKLHVEIFTREMLETTNDKKVAEATKKKNWDEIEILGVLLFGPESEVKELTKDIPLYS